MSASTGQMPQGLSQLDRRLLDLLQRGLPLVRRPFVQLAQQLGASEDEIVSRVGGLAAPGGVIREIAGIFDAAAMGFASTLAAAKCPPERLDECGAVAAGHPGVSHCYGRAGELNLWFTLVVPPDSRLGLDGTLAALARKMGVGSVLSLPVLRRYKLDVRFNQAEPDESGVARLACKPCSSTGETPVGRMGGTPMPRGGRMGETAPRSVPKGMPRPSEAQIRAIRALQSPLPAVGEPFDALAAQVDMSADDLLVHAADFLAAGWLRRYAAVLRHRQAGAVVNVMVAWSVPPESADAFGRAAADLPAVSHCYLRQAAPNWPYNLYTMLHGRSDADVAAALSELAAAARRCSPQAARSPAPDDTGLPRAVLPTLSEYKKAKVRLFSPDFARWEEENCS